MLLLFIACIVVIFSTAITKMIYPEWLDPIFIYPAILGISSALCFVGSIITKENDDCCGCFDCQPFMWTWGLLLLATIATLMISCIIFGVQHAHDIGGFFV